MPWNAEHKIQSREKILSSAAQLFSHHGFDAVSIDDVMAHAGLTRGAFYSYFKSKSEVYHQAMVTSAVMFRDKVCAHPSTATEMAETYLDIGRHARADRYCPLAFLITDIGQREPDIQAAYTHILKKYQERLASLGLSQKDAIAASVILIGGLALSRAVVDEAMKNEILDCCLEQVENLEREQGSVN